MSVIMTTLLNAVKKGEAKPHSLLKMLKTQETLEYGDKWARFRKIKPGQFVIEIGVKGEEAPLEEQTAESPIEAKLAVIDALVH